MKSFGEIALEAAQMAGLMIFMAFVSFAIEGDLARWGSVGTFIMLVMGYLFFFVIAFLFGVFFYRRR